MSIQVFASSHPNCAEVCRTAWVGNNVGNLWRPRDQVGTGQCHGWRRMTDLSWDSRHTTSLNHHPHYTQWSDFAIKTHYIIHIYYLEDFFQWLPKERAFENVSILKVLKQIHSCHATKLNISTKKMIPWKNVNVDQKQTKGCDYDRFGAVVCCAHQYVFWFSILVSRLTGCQYYQQQHHEVRRLLELWRRCRGSGEVRDWVKTTFPSQGAVTSSGQHQQCMALVPCIFVWTTTT